jgi:DNA-binding transcriptional LysR family regulator
LDGPKAELLSLAQFRCFAETARRGSFTAAADALDVSQPAVAEQVRGLERTLGVALFARNARGVTLTTAGEAFAPHAGAALAAVEDAVRAVEDVATARTGTLAFGLFASPVAYRLDEMIARFARAYPGLVLRLVGRNSSDAAERVRAGELEAALVALPIDAERLDVRPLLRDEVVYVSADPARTRGSVTIRELAARPIVFFDVGSGDSDPTRRQLHERAQEAGLTLRPRIEVETLVMALRLVAEGLGDTYLPRAHTSGWHFPPGLSTTSFDPPMEDTLALVTRSGASVSPAMRLFLAHVEDHMAGIAGTLDVTGSRRSPSRAPGRPAASAG